MELTRLTAKFERDLQMKTKNKDEQKVLTIKYAKEKESFEKNMTLKREKKKESVTKKLLEQERALAAPLVPQVPGLAQHAAAEAQVSRQSARDYD